MKQFDPKSAIRVLLAMSFGVFSLAQAGTLETYGASDKDGTVREFQQYLTTREPPDSVHYSFYDFNHDGKTNSADLTLLKRSCLYTPEQFFQENVLPDNVWEHSTYSDTGSYYEAEGTYFFTDCGNVWCFSLLSDEARTDFQLITEQDTIRALHLWKPDQSEIDSYLARWSCIPDIDDEIPKAEVSSTSRPNAWSELSSSTIPFIANLMLQNGNYGLSPESYVKYYDYNYSGTLDLDDYCMITRYYCSGIPSLLGVYGLDPKITDFVFEVQPDQPGISPSQRYFDKKVVPEHIWNNDAQVYAGALYESAGTFFFRNEGEIWCYNLLSEEFRTDYQLLMNNELVQALHIWKPDQSLIDSYLAVWGNIPDISDALPEGGLFVDPEGAISAYMFCEWGMIEPSAIEAVSGIVSKSMKSDFWYISKYDYNRSSRLEQEDLMTVTRYYCANLPALLGVPALDSGNSNYIFDVQTGQLETVS